MNFPKDFYPMPGHEEEALRLGWEPPDIEGGDGYWRSGLLKFSELQCIKCGGSLKLAQDQDSQEFMAFCEACERLGPREGCPDDAWLSAVVQPPGGAGCRLNGDQGMKTTPPVVHGVNCDCDDSCLEFSCSCGYYISSNSLEGDCPECGKPLRPDSWTDEEWRRYGPQPENSKEIKA